MSIILERTTESITVAPVTIKPDHLELTIHYDGGHVRHTWLSVSEARIVAYRLLAEAEHLAGGRRTG
jgi:hypothetical protein